jgi:hypothetical protein
LRDPGGKPGGCSREVLLQPHLAFEVRRPAGCRHCRRTIACCHRKSVRGVTNSTLREDRVRCTPAAASSARSTTPSLGRATCRRKTRRGTAAQVCAGPGGEHRRLRFLHRRDGVSAPLLRVVLHRACASRRVWLAGCTKNPSGDWVTQQARNLGPDFTARGVRFLIRDPDSRYSGAFDEVFVARHPDPENAGASTEGKRDRGALRPLRTCRVTRLAADPQRPSPRTRAPRLHRPLQPREAASCSRTPGTRIRRATTKTAGLANNGAVHDHDGFHRFPAISDPSGDHAPLTSVTPRLHRAKPGAYPGDPSIKVAADNPPSDQWRATTR